MVAIEQLVTDNITTWTSAVQAKSATGRGTSNKLELYGIKKLRELILELAVRGLLVPQDPSDEPASELLNRLSAEKARMVEEGKIRKQKALPPVEEDEKLFQLPTGWEWCRLADTAFSQAGFAFKSKGFNESGIGFPLIRIRDVGQPFSGTFYDGEYREEFVVTEGDYLISMDGNFRVAPWKGSDALLNQRVSRLIFFGDFLSQRFIAESLQHRLSELQGVKAYTTVDHLSGGQISNSVVALPPSEEQHRIVAKVDELMDLCDQLEQQQEASITAHQILVHTLLESLTTASERDGFTAAWARIADHFDTLFTTEWSIDQLKQTILQLAVMGKLVPQDAEEEPAKLLLAKIAKEKARLIKAKKTKKQKTFPEIGDEDKPFELPSSWAWVRFADLATQITDGAHHTPEYVEQGIPFLSVKDMSSGFLNFSNTRFISEEQHADLIRRCNPEKGDLLLTKVGTTGIPVLVDTDREFSIFVSVALIKFPQEFLMGEYLSLLVSAPLVKTQSEEGTEGVGNKNLVLRKISAFILSLPPLAEQRRIVSRVKELLALCESLKARMLDSQGTLIHLADAAVEQSIA